MQGLFGPTVPKIQDIGLMTGATSIQNLPDEECRAIMLLAPTDNSQSLFVGTNGDEAHWQLEPGDSVQLIPIQNLNLLYFNGDTNGDILVWWKFK